MARYIDADALNLYDNLFMSKDTINKSGVYVRYKTIENLIKNAPIADVQKEKHGKWIHDESCSFCEHRCSQCGYKWDYNGIDVQYYCANCGAKMDL